MVSFFIVWLTASLIFICVLPSVFWSGSLGNSIPFAFMLGAVVALVFYITQQLRKLNDLEERIKRLEESIKSDKSE